MCDAGAIIAVVSAAASAAYSAHAAHEVDQKEGAATIAELERQKKMQHDGDSIVQKNLKAQGAEGEQATMRQSASARTAQYNQAATDAAKFAPSGQNLDSSIAGPRAISDAYSREATGNDNFLRQQGAAKAAMQSFGDAQLGAALQNAQAGYQLQNLNANRIGSQGAFGAELGAAGHAGDQSKSLGNALGALSGTAASYSNIGSGSSAPKSGGGGGGGKTGY